MNSPNLPNFGAYLLSNPQDGVNGEPYCFFVLIQEPLFTLGNYLRMHIILNPKLFPKAVNGPGVNDASLAATIQYFNCTTNH